mmetsp:Transcript_25924/g.56259  ORF Transcript_25924/g.56259 Transcript_25924/m.56259 type:complete len:218 (-) Transcript_25924:59-712(-)
MPARSSRLYISMPGMPGIPDMDFMSLSISTSFSLISSNSSMGLRSFLTFGAGLEHALLSSRHSSLLNLARCISPLKRSSPSSVSALSMISSQALAMVRHSFLHFPGLSRVTSLILSPSSTMSKNVIHSPSSFSGSHTFSVISRMSNSASFLFFGNSSRIFFTSRCRNLTISSHTEHLMYLMSLFTAGALSFFLPPPIPGIMPFDDTMRRASAINMHS